MQRSVVLARVMVSLPKLQKGVRGTGLPVGSDMAGAMSTGSFCARAISTCQQSPSRRKADIAGLDNILVFMGELDIEGRGRFPTAAVSSGFFGGLGNAGCSTQYTPSVQASQRKEISSPLVAFAVGSGSGQSRRVPHRLAVQSLWNLSIARSGTPRYHVAVPTCGSATPERLSSRRSCRLSTVVRWFRSVSVARTVRLRVSRNRSIRTLASRRLSQQHNGWRSWSSRRKKTCCQGLNANKR